MSWSLLQLSWLIETQTGNEDLHYKDNGFIEKSSLITYVSMLFYSSWNVFLFNKLIVLDYTEIQESLLDIQSLFILIRFFQQTISADAFQRAGQAGLNYSCCYHKG